MNLPQQVATHFRTFYNGENWTDVNLKDTLEGVTWQQATASIFSCVVVKSEMANVKGPFFAASLKARLNSDREVYKSAYTGGGPGEANTPIIQQVRLPMYSKNLPGHSLTSPCVRKRRREGNRLYCR